MESGVSLQNLALRVEQATLAGEMHQVGLAFQPKLTQQVGAVRLSGAWTHRQLPKSRSD